MTQTTADVPQILASRQQEILTEWQNLLKSSSILESGRIKDAELQTQCRSFLAQLDMAIQHDATFNASGAAFQPVRSIVEDISSTRAMQGFSPAETALFIFSLKQPIFNALSKSGLTDSERAAAIWKVTLLLDELGLFSVEAYQKTREKVIERQAREIAELSTPVVKLWNGIVAVPLIGTLDSERTQVVMENLLQSIVDQAAEIAIIDITGVPTVDTLIAQHLLKTVAAARLMGADCIISGIRPQIAQTMVHLGVELNVVSKPNLAEALALALRRTGRIVVAAKSTSPDRTSTQ